jgi:Na+/alanine symporter
MFIQAGNQKEMVSREINKRGVSCILIFFIFFGYSSPSRLFKIAVNNKEGLNVTAFIKQNKFTMILFKVYVLLSKFILCVDEVISVC